MYDLNDYVYQGDAIIIPTYPPDADENKEEGSIKYLISAPTMRVPMNVSETVNAYLAFRACLIAGKLMHTAQCCVLPRIKLILHEWLCILQ